MIWQYKNRQGDCIYVEMPPHLFDIPPIATIAVADHIGRKAQHQIRMGDKGNLFRAHFDGEAYLRWVDHKYEGEVDAEATIR